ncbi:MAG TPA: ring-cleaving dioxygenase [Nitrososphaerales archaeon]|nr:ring-cleaving dioxygenase [Nitrososphaerales archaeon]
MTTKNVAEKEILGLHHVTAISGIPQANIDFYTGILGLRLVKLTVNFDDPHTYHLYYGDKIGHPGSVLTFFPWPNAPRGMRGTGQVTTTSFSIPDGSMDYWKDRLRDNKVKFEEVAKRFDDNEEYLTFYDEDDLKLELVPTDQTNITNLAKRFIPWEGSPVPQEKAILGFRSVTLSEEGYEKTAKLLSDTMGFRLIAQERERFRYESRSHGGPSTYVDLLCQPGLPRGMILGGTVHHVAFRAQNDENEKVWREDIIAAGLNPTPVIDRQYFHSVYFREPGGVLFEIATDPPGFLIDEPEDKLGTSLKLPPWLEPSRKHIEKALPKVELFGRDQRRLIQNQAIA